MKSLGPRIKPPFVNLDFPRDCYNNLSEFSPNVLSNIINTGVGVEVEVENAGIISGLVNWQPTADNSLRDHGVEFKTRFGVRYGNLPLVLKELHVALKENYSRHRFTERCSTHVHLDIRRFEQEQLQNLLIIYTLMEDALFNLAGELRKDNIFTVPIRSSLSTMSSTCSGIWEYIQYCSKYTAMNLRCASDFGTVEFRHLEGTSNPERILKWITLLVLIHRAAADFDTEELKFQVKKLKNDSQYEQLLHRIFGKFLPMLQWRGTDLDSAVSDSKLFFWEEA
jgi:hypothetical protein